MTDAGVKGCCFLMVKFSLEFLEGGRKGANPGTEVESEGNWRAEVINHQHCSEIKGETNVIYEAIGKEEFYCISQLSTDSIPDG